MLIAYCPERILPGHMLRELIENDRVIGGLDRRSARARPRALRDLRRRARCLMTDARSRRDGRS